jgi:predicted O-methyltransferase YrrM
MNIDLLENAIDLYTKEARFAQINPKHSHLQVIYDIKEKMETCNYLEIGSLFGFSMIHPILSKTPGVNIGIDLFEDGGEIGINNYNPDILERGLSKEKTTRLVSQCNVHNHDFTFIQGNSLSNDTYSKVTSICEEFDIIFIDGDHSYEGTKNDFNKYSPLLKKGGYLMFDDQDYDEIGRVCSELRSGDLYEWIPSSWAPKMNGYFRKL